MSVEIRTVPSRLLAAVHRSVRPGEVAGAWRAPLDQVWAFLRANPGLRTDGHNIFVYRPVAGMLECDFGVEVTRTFEPSGDVALVSTPAGRVASALHVGPYDRLMEAYGAIEAWIAANGEQAGGVSWELYGDWVEDPSKLETRVELLLR
jgi:hypothetical protein